MLHFTPILCVQAFGTDVNGLPLSIVLSWFEQKAVAVLLSLLSMGVKNIRIGPALPAFVTPGALALLQVRSNCSLSTRVCTHLAHSAGEVQFDAN